MLETPLQTRRKLLKHSAVGFGHLALTALLQRDSAATESHAASLHPLAAKKPPLPARAKRIVFLFMKGGPSHVDTFDPKPFLDRDDGKPLPFDLPRVTFAKQGNLLKSPWRFQPYGESGLPVSELFPHVAEHVDDLCILRSVHGTNPAHGGALLKLHTGSDQFVRPSLGSWVTYGLGTDNENLPAFITICPTLAHGGVNNWGAAFLPAYCQGTPIGNASLPAKSVKVKHIRNSRVDLQTQRRQLDLIHEMNREHLSSVGSNQALEGRLNSFELAYRMQSSMPEIQDLSEETNSTMRLYGIDDPVTEDFGRQCLMARRFLERGVRFVQVTHSDSEVQWDQHSDLYQGHTKNASEVDKPIAGFLSDLKARGLLRDTLVLWGGEFGRTPTAQGNNGRDHNPHGFTMWMAGGGVKGGYAYGATDDYGYYAAENKMHVHDLHATILYLLGLDHERLTYRYAGRDFRLTDVAGNVATDISGVTQPTSRRTQLSATPKKQNMPVADLTDEERATYEWQMWIGDLGEEGQRKLKNASVMVSRVGGVGSVVAYELAAAGVGKLVLAHAGNVKPSDLNRQLLMTHDWIGKPRIESIERRLYELNPRLEIIAVAQNVNEDNAAQLVSQCDLIVDCAPLFPERFAMNRQAVLQNKPLVECSMYEMEAHLTTVIPGRSPCLQCIFPEDPPMWKRQFPVLGAVSGTVACMGAVEAVKVIAGIGDPLAGRLLRMDLRRMSFHVMNVARRTDCAVCGSGQRDVRR